MDVEQHYFMLKLTSSWTVAGITNLEFKLMYINHILG